MLEIRLLGPIEIRLSGAALALRYDKLRALLAYLAVESARPHPREALAALLWPEAPDADARRNLSQALFNLRQALGAGGSAETPYLLASRETLQFNPASAHTVDTREFEALWAACAAHVHASPSTCAECAARWQAAVQLYRGDFLQDFYLPDSTGFEEWTLLQREDFRRRALAALAHLAAYFERQADYEQSVNYTRRQLALEPWREEAHRDLMRLLAVSGQRSAALAQYEAARKALAEELGAPPAAETETLLAQIKAGEWERPREAAAPAAPDIQAVPLPLPLTAFVGRTRELADLARLLAEPDCRLLTLTGPGGIGKTRLAIQAAAVQASAFALGAVWVPLGNVAHTGQLMTTVADALGVSLPSTAQGFAFLAQKLKGRSVLLVLDNFEHLLANGGAAGWLSEAARGLPSAKLLITSREALGLQGEWVFPVEGLGDEAVDLFVQAARRARAGFELAAADRPHVERICALVGATPLAVELAASWVRVLSPAEIAEEIAGAFAARRQPDVLATQARDLPERHRSLVAVFDHSWQLLPAEEQTVLGRLSVFRGGFARPAAEQVAGASLAVIAALSAKSLLRRAGQGRYDLHPLVLQYAAERLARAPGALHEAHAGHCDYYARFMAERAETMRGSRQREAVAEVAGDFDNVQAAWAWAVEHKRVAELRQMGLTLYYFAQRRSRYREGLEMLAEAIARVEDDPSAEAQEALAGFLLQRAWLHIRLGQLDQAEADSLRGQALFERLSLEPVHHMMGDPIMARGLIEFIRGNYPAATALYEEVLAILRYRGDPMALTYVHLYLATAKRALGEGAAGEEYARQAHGLAQQSGQPWVIAFSLDELGFMALERGDPAQARSLFEQALMLREMLGDPSSAAGSLVHLGLAALASGQAAEARELFERSAAVYRETGDQGGLAAALHGLGRAHLAGGRPEAASEPLRQALGITRQHNFMPLALSILASLAELAAATGDAPETQRLASMVLIQAASDHETRMRAARLVEGLGLAAPTEPAEDLRGVIASLLGRRVS
jgi:predicted ATPase/DNA-binding SARP family transcriptional activator